jgi:Holliday junction resolvase RusA-like endonuclease
MTCEWRHVVRITFRLPFPPTANHYNQQRVYMSCGKPRVLFYRTKRAQGFYTAVSEIVRERFDEPPLLTDRLTIHIELVAPNKHRRDVSNYTRSRSPAAT